MDEVADVGGLARALSSMKDDKTAAFSFDEAVYGFGYGKEIIVIVSGEINVYFAYVCGFKVEIIVLVGYNEHIAKRFLLLAVACANVQKALYIGGGSLSGIGYKAFVIEETEHEAVFA